MTDDLYFVLFSNCIPVVGSKEMAIYDVQYGDLYKFPAELAPMLKAIEAIPVIKYAEFYDKETCNALDRAC